MRDPVNASEQFRSFALTIMDEQGVPQAQWDAVNGLYDLLYRISGRPRDVTDPDAQHWRRETILSSGKAIDPYSAATCVLDLKRTSAFARGVRSAIAAARAKFPGEAIDLLYAGTGPFAPLALLQTAFCSAGDVRFTLLDIHEQALDCLETVISELGLDPYVRDLIQADASDWRPSDDRKFHVIVAEVMQRALIKEPQVAVTLNLIKHLRTGGAFVPARVEVQPCLLDPSKEHAVADDQARDPSPMVRHRIRLGAPFVLSADSARNYIVTEEGSIRLPDVCLPPRIEANYELRILTRIVTFGDIVLDDYESGLTVPYDPLDEVNPAPGTRLELRYVLGDNPGLVFNEGPITPHVD